jgi:pimeloyl-ACP methyl ester carboxylesterase
MALRASFRSLRLRIGYVLAGIYVVATLAMGIVLAEFFLHLPKRHVEDGMVFRARVWQQFHASVEDVSVKAADGAVLKAWYVRPPKPRGEAVLLLHGITGNRVDPSGFGDIFLKQGYSVLLPDSREHGESGGRIATYGILEREDVRRWVGFARKRDPGCTYLLGESMGAAIGLQATSVTPQLCAVAVESPYANFREISYERLGNETHLGTLFWKTLGRPAVEVAIVYARIRYKVYLPDAAPGKAVENSRVPTLLIAGTEDRDIPMHHAQELLARCEKHCWLWIIPGARHGGASTVVPVTFEFSVLDFFQKHDHAKPVPRLAKSGIDLGIVGGSFQDLAGL